MLYFFFFFSSRRRHTRSLCDWSSDVCSSDLCVCANRMLVQDGIHHEFVERFRAAVQALSIGNGFDDGVEQGPLIDDAAVAKRSEERRVGKECRCRWWPNDVREEEERRVEKKE